MRTVKLLILFIISITNSFSMNIDLNIKKWLPVHYSKIEPNSITSTKNGLEISVNQSSSALVFPFNSPKILTSLSIKAKMKGNINYNNLSPGSKDSDDFPLRLGLILKGKNKLNFWQKALAPDWLVRLDKVSSKEGGLDKVYSLIFYTNSPSFKQREHPGSSYFSERVAGKFRDNSLNYTLDLKLNKEVIGIWLSSDGDDTKSSFKVIIEDIEVH